MGVKDGESQRDIRDRPKQEGGRQKGGGRQGVGRERRQEGWWRHIYVRDG